ncbi:CsrA-like regulator [Vibrio phage VvAW1]|uniref:CsrA-like regulator n=1 Tax=Vibrio phage VvAW1 TaxID=1168281 RepID=UPI000263B07B|nr:CsrA-like regulator [Vibrio phage VvAW1]AFH14498.1 RNA-binding regulator protein [Vibrio phage VvAW1]
MLILTRRISEKLIIDTGREVIEIVPLGVNGSQVKLGVNAPKHIPVHREEVKARIDADKTAESSEWQKQNR